MQILDVYFDLTNAYKGTNKRHPSDAAAATAAVNELPSLHGFMFLAVSPFGLGLFLSLEWQRMSINYTTQNCHKRVNPHPPSCVTSFMNAHKG